MSGTTNERSFALAGKGPSRRAVTAGLALSLAGLGASHARAEPLAIRIGYQKNGILPIARQQKALEQRFGGSVAINWLEFSAGPPMLEAMNAGSVDIGQVGDAPPVFAQAAGANIVYVAGQAVTNGQGIIVKPDSPIRTIADLKGKRIGFAKGSSAHNVAIATLESAGIDIKDVQLIYLSPPDAAAAFARDSIDAWGIWDPFLAIAERKHGARLLVDGVAVAQSNSFYLANKSFAAEHPRELATLLDALGGVAIWAEANRDKVGETLAVITGVDLAAQKLAAERATYVIGRVDDQIIATQQKVADRFHRLGIIPRPIVVRDAVWTPPQT